MSGTKYLIDTCTLIGLQKQTPESVKLLSEKQIYLSECAISLITYMEFVGFYGVDKATAQQLENIAKRFVCYPISATISQATIQIRQNHKIKLPDALILATAQVHQLALLTLDEKLARIYQQVQSDFQAA